jgi:transposase
MAQGILPILPAGSTLITNTLSVVNEGDTWTYFQGLLPVFSHAQDQVQSFRMFTAQLAANGSCKLVDIEKAFGVSAISVKRAVKLYRTGGCGAFFAPRRGRGAGVLLPQKVKALQALLDEGLSYREAARREEVHHDTVRKGIDRGLLRVIKKNESPTAMSRPRTRASGV